MSAAQATDTLDRPQVTRGDLEAKMRELQGEVNETAGSATNVMAVAIGVGAVVTIAVVFLLGRRSGKRKTTVVEVRRV